jgi:hypothetical protein
MKLRDTGLLNTRLTIDTDWQTEIRQAAIHDAATPPNAVQAAAFHLATVTGVVPIGVIPGTKNPMRAGTSGYVVLPEADTVIEEIGLLTEHHNIGIRPPAGIVGIDVDSYIKNGHTKNGHEQLAYMESLYGALPPTWSSSRRTYNPDNRSGIYYFKLPDKVTRWYTRRNKYPKFVSQINSNIEIVQMTHRYAVVAPSTVDGLTYTWRRPDGTTEPGLLPPSFAELPELPGPWVLRLVENMNGKAQTRALRAGRRPGEDYTGGNYTENARLAVQWCADNIAGWNDPPDAYLQHRINDATSRFTLGASRHMALSNSIWHLLGAAIGNATEGTFGHPGGADAINQVIDTFLKTKPNALGDAARNFSNAVDKISDRIETGDLIPLPQTDFRFKPGGKSQ